MKQIILIGMILLLLLGCMPKASEEELKAINAVKNHKYTDSKGKIKTLEKRMEIIVEGAISIADDTPYSPNDKLDVGRWKAKCESFSCPGLEGEDCCIVTYRVRDIHGSWFVGKESLKVLGSDSYTKEVLCGDKC